MLVAALKAATAEDACSKVGAASARVAWAGAAFVKLRREAVLTAAQMAQQVGWNSVTAAYGTADANAGMVVVAEGA